MDRAVRYRRLGVALTASECFVLTYDLATASAGILPELLTVLLGIYVLGGLAAGWLRLGYLWDRLKRAPYLAAGAAVYLAADLISALYAPTPAAVWGKYRAVGGFLVVVLAVVLVANRREALDALHLSLAAASLTAALCTVINQQLPVFYPIYYHLRLSPRADYNMFATALLTGLTCGCITLLYGRGPLPNWVRQGGFALLLLSVLPVLYLSGSRRVYLLLPIFLLLFVYTLLIAMSRVQPRGAVVLRGSAVVLLLAVLCGGLTAGYNGIMVASQELPLTGWGGTGREGGETAAVERYETAMGGGMLTKRLVLYRVALDEIAGFSAGEWVMGRGLGYNILLYDRDDPRIVELYPDEAARRGNLSAHNMLLGDLLDGGLIKLVALLLMLAAAGWHALKLTLRRPERGIIYLAVLGLCVVGSMVSNRYGLLYDRYFMLMGAMLLVEMGLMEEDDPRFDAQHAAPTR